MPPSSPHPIVARLTAEARFVRRRRRLALVLGVLLLTACPLLLAGLLDLAWTLREGTAALIAAAALLGGLAGAIAAVIAYRRRRTTLDQMALAVEHARPTYMDALVCAVELLRRPAAELNPLHQALLAQVAGQLEHEDLRSVSRRATLGTSALAGLAAAVLAAVVALAWLPLTAKAVAHCRDTLAGTSTGLLVAPGDIEVAAGDDLTITATIRRGPPTARLLLQGERGLLTYDLYSAGGEAHTLELYGVDSDFTYRVETPTLRSRRYRVTTFRRPEVERVVLAVTPPGYTGLAPSRQEQWTNLTAPHGAQLTITLTTNMPVSARLQPEGGEPLPFRPGAEPTAHELTLTIERNLRYQVWLDDLKGHQVAATTPLTIECLPDAPPVVQLLEPAEDGSRDKDDRVPFQLSAVDDYGLRTVRLAYSVNGNPFQTVDLFQAAPGERVPERNATHELALAGLVAYGDVVYYYGLALDNREPTPNEGRTDIRFLEIRPGKGNLQQLPSIAGQSGGQQQTRSLTLDVSDLIQSQKHLIRQTWRAGQLTGIEERRLLVEELAVLGADLHLNTAKRYNDLREMAQGLPLGILDKLFPDAVAAMQSAQQLLQSQAAAESLRFQQTALARLIAIELELLKQQPQNSMAGKGGKPSEQQSPDGQSQDQNQAKARQQQLDALQDQLKRIQELAERQEALNRDMARQQENDRFTGDFRATGGRRQQDLLVATYDVRNRLTQIREAQEAAQELVKASQAMTSTRQSMQVNRAADATRQGQLAAQFLRRSEQLLEQLIEQAAGNAFGQLAAALEAMKQQQGQLKDQTRQAAGGQGGQPGEALATDQRALRQAYEQWLQAMTQATGELEQQNPAAAKTMSGVLANARGKQVDGTMKRAENAMRYKQLPRGAEFAEQSEQALAELAKQLGDAAKQAGGPGKEALSRMLQETLAQLEQMQQLAERNADAAEKTAQAKAMQEHLDQLARQLKEKAFQELARQGQDLGTATGNMPAENLQQMMALTTQAARMLEMKLLELNLNQRVVFSRLAGKQAPDEYRKLVNEYFRKLSEEP